MAFLPHLPHHRSLIVLLLAVTLLSFTLAVAPNAQAAGPFFCTATEASAGDGSASHPWVCGTPDQFQAAVTRVCRAGGGVLYFVFPEGYIQYQVTADCNTQAGSAQNGQPPDTGVGLPLPWLLTAGALLGLALIAAGARLTMKTAAPSPGIHPSA